MNIRVESGNMFPPRTLPGVRKTFDKSGDGEINVRPARRLSIHVVVIFSVSMTTRLRMAGRWFSVLLLMLLMLLLLSCAVKR